MAATKLRFEINAEHELTGVEIELMVKCSVTPGHPGRTYGPPENCYPAEPPEVEDLKVYHVVGGGLVEMPEAEWAVYGLDLEMLQEMAILKAEEHNQGLKEDEDERRSSRDD